MERVNIYHEGGTVTADDLRPFLPQSSALRGTPSSLKEATENFEREYIKGAVDRHAGNMAEAARTLGLERSHLYKKMKKLGM